MKIVDRTVKQFQSVCLHQHITNHVRTLVKEGKLRAGDPLPSERNLSREFGVSHTTVRKGLAVLVNEGLIKRRVGRGTFVAGGPRNRTGKRRRHCMIAVMVSQKLRELPFLGYGIKGVREVLPQDDFGVEVLGIGPDGFNDKMLAVFKEREIEGVLYLGYLSANYIAKFDRANVALVKIGDLSSQVRGTSVWCDTEDLFQQIIKEAYRFGHREIAQVVWLTKDADGSEVDVTGFDKYAAACRRFNLLGAANTVVRLQGSEVPDPAVISTNPLFDLDPFPTCLIVNDEIMAGAVMRDLEACGLRVPDDVSIISLMDHSPQMHRVPLTAPDSNTDLRDFFRIGAEMLLEQLAGRQPDPMRRRVRVNIRFKASLGPAPGWRVPDVSEDPVSQADDA